MIKETQDFQEMTPEDLARYHSVLNQSIVAKVNCGDITVDEVMCPTRLLEDEILKNFKRKLHWMRAKYLLTHPWKILKIFIKPGIINFIFKDSLE